MIEDPFNAPSQSNQHWPRRIAKLDRTPKTHKIVSPIGEALLDKKRSVRDAVISSGPVGKGPAAWGFA